MSSSSVLTYLVAMVPVLIVLVVMAKSINHEFYIYQSHLEHILKKANNGSRRGDAGGEYPPASRKSITTKKLEFPKIKTFIFAYLRILNCLIFKTWNLQKNYDTGVRNHEIFKQ